MSLFAQICSLRRDTSFTSIHNHLQVTSLVLAKHNVGTSRISQFKGKTGRPCFHTKLRLIISPPGVSEGEKSERSGWLSDRVKNGLSVYGRIEGEVIMFSGRGQAIEIFFGMIPVVVVSLPWQLIDVQCQRQY